MEKNKINKINAIKTYFKKHKILCKIYENNDNDIDIIYDIHINKNLNIETPNFYTFIANEYFVSGNHVLAFEFYHKALNYYLDAHDNSATNSIYNIAYLYEEMINFDIDIDLNFYAIIKKHYENNLNKFALFCCCISDIFVKDNNLFLAEKLCLKATDTNCHEAMIYLAEIYVKMDKYDLVEKYYLMAIDIDNKFTVAMILLGTVYAYQKKYDLAEKYFLMAMNNNDENAERYLVILYEDMNELDKAAYYYQKMLENNKISNIQYIISAYEKLGKNELADKYKSITKKHIEDLHKNQNIVFT